MPLVRRYEFELSFDAPHLAAASAPPPEAEPELIVEPEPVEPPPPPEPTFSQAELEDAFARGLANGKQEGEIEAMSRVERRLAETADRLAYQFKELAEHQIEAMALVERQAAEMTLTALKKLFPAFLSRGGTAEIQTMLAQAFEHALEEPRILVRTAPDMRDQLEKLVRNTAGQAGFDGKLIIIEDPRLDEMDCRIEWAEGGVERSPRRVMDTIEAAVARGLADFDRRHATRRTATTNALEEAAQ